MSNDHARPLPSHLEQLLRKLGAALVPEPQRWLLEEFKMLGDHASTMDEHIRDQQRHYDASFQYAFKDLEDEDKAFYALQQRADFLTDKGLAKRRGLGVS
ncbi:hypothetical protein ACU4HD_11465 [Cupriavidus basilensis]